MKPKIKNIVIAILGLVILIFFIQKCTTPNNEEDDISTEPKEEIAKSECSFKTIDLETGSNTLTTKNKISLDGALSTNLKKINELVVFEGDANADITNVVESIDKKQFHSKYNHEVVKKQNSFIEALCVKEIAFGKESKEVKSGVIEYVEFVKIWLGVPGLIDEPEEEPVVDEPEEEPVVDEPGEEPVVDEPGEEPVVDEPGEEPVVDEPREEPVVDEPGEEPVVSSGKKLVIGSGKKPVHSEKIKDQEFLNEINKLPKNPPPVTDWTFFIDREEKLEFKDPIKVANWKIKDILTSEVVTNPYKYTFEAQDIGRYDSELLVYRKVGGSLLKIFKFKVRVKITQDRLAEILNNVVLASYFPIEDKKTNAKTWEAYVRKMFTQTDKPIIKLLGDSQEVIQQYDPPKFYLREIPLPNEFKNKRIKVNVVRIIYSEGINKDYKIKEIHVNHEFLPERK